jgi:hypothetical protein
LDYFSINNRNRKNNNESRFKLSGGKKKKKTMPTKNDHTTDITHSPLGGNGSGHGAVSGGDYNVDDEANNNRSLSKGFDHRDNDPLITTSPSPSRNKIYILHGSGGSLSYDNGTSNAQLNGSGGLTPGAAAGGIELQFLPPDQRPGLPGDLLASLIEPEIEDDTEAAEALRANASVKVGKVGKVARSVNAQTVRKLVKKATLRGHGNKRGKPPRIPPGLASAGNQQQHIVMTDDGNQIYVVEEADNESEYYEHGEDASDVSSASLKEEDDQEHHEEYVQPLASGDYPGTSREETGRGHSHDTGSAGDPVKAADATKRKVETSGEDQEDIPTEVVAATMDAGKKLMGALDPHNMLQFQRWRRKKKGGKKQRKSYGKGKVIDGRHELYTLSIAVMLGVRTSIARTNTIISASDGPGKKMLSPQDFMAEEKYEFAPKVRKRNFYSMLRRTKVSILFRPT